MEKILKVAEQQGIIIEKYPLGENIMGIYFKTSSIKNPLIVLNESLSLCEIRIVIAHELGHHFTTIGLAVYRHCDYGKTLQVNKIEKAARKWAGKFLIPDDDLIKTLKHGQPSIYELAQKYNVTEEFARTRLKIMKEEEYALRHGTLLQRISTAAYLGGCNTL